MASESKKSNAVIETIKTVVYALLIAGIFRTVLFQPFWIPSGSMKDTLLVGDFLFVNKMAYGYSYASCPTIRIGALGIDIDAADICAFLDGDNTRIIGSEPERGDIIVFRHPVQGTDFIKRVVGKPGDRVQVRDSVLHINGTPVGIEPAGTFEEVFARQGPLGVRPRCENGVVGQGAICEKSRFIETLPTGARTRSSTSRCRVRTIRRFSGCRRGTISSWATTVTIPPIPAFPRPSGVSGSCLTRT